MKAILTSLTLAVLMTGCNAMTDIADGAMNKQSSFSQNPTTIYPTVDGQKDSEPAEFAKQQFNQ